MINIFSITSDQISLATELCDVKETDTVKKEQAYKADHLYRSLKKKPDFLKVHKEIQPKIIDGCYEDPLSFFSNPKRIIYLSRWVLRITPFIDLLETAAHLPIERSKEDFEGFINDIFERYLSTLKSIHLKIPKDINMLRDIDIKNATEISKKIQEAVKKYFEGYPSPAFKNIEDIFHSNLFPQGYLNKQMTILDRRGGRLYKMRTGTGHAFTAKEMFHIPFEKRGFVNTNRYSIPGLPCVYLGSSPLVCWEELNRPDLNTVQTSLFVKKSVSYLDFSTPPGALLELLIGKFNFNGFSDDDNDNMKEIYKDLISHIVVWPLMAACSIKVKHPKDSFKPEYIIPQLLLQWVRESTFDGISYFSTKLDNYTLDTAKLYTNYAFPAQEHKKTGHCPKLWSKLKSSDAIPWQTFQIYKDSPSAMPNEEAINVEFELVNGLALRYSKTDFSKLESLLINQG